MALIDKPAAKATEIKMWLVKLIDVFAMGRAWRDSVRPVFGLI
jgi:hypothetical protein